MDIYLTMAVSNQKALTTLVSAHIQILFPFGAMYQIYAFSFAVLCIILFRLSSILGAVGLFRSDLLLICNMVWP